ncbi:hypothetical protein D3C75_619250 [compost metagenome]
MFLLIGSAGKDGAERGPLHDQKIAGVVADPAQFLDGDAGGQQAVGAAVLGWEGEREQPQLLEQGKHVMGIFRRAVDLIRSGRDLFPGNPTDQVLDFSLFIGQFVIHGFHGSSHGLHPLHDRSLQGKVIF